MNKALLRCISVTVLIGLCSGCVPLRAGYGGGTAGTGIGAGYSKGESKVRSGDVSYFDLDAELRNARGEPLPHLHVSVSTSRDTVTTTTGPKGTIRVPVIAEVGETITFTLRGPGGKVENTVQTPRGGVSYARCVLRLQGNATLAKPSCEFYRD